MSSGEKYTGVGMVEYARRRTQLLAELAPNSIAIIASGTEQLPSLDTYFPCRQDSDFLYLTGFPEPEALLVLLLGRSQGETLLFCREREREKECWEGPRLGPERALSQFGLSDAFPISDLDDNLPGLLGGRERVYFPMGRYAHLDWRLRAHRQAIEEAPGNKRSPEMVDLDYQLWELRQRHFMKLTWRRSERR
ncbi:hypothetical protein GCM10027180_01220 [Microbulbifer echini]